MNIIENLCSKRKTNKFTARSVHLTNHTSSQADFLDLNIAPRFRQMENSNNSYWCQPWTELVYYYGHIYPAVCLFIFGLTFNPIALYYFATSKHFSRTAYAFYFSAIAIVDWTRLILWSLFLFLDYKVFRLDFYSFECSMQLYTESVASSISAWLTVALAVERSLVIYNPLQTLTDIRGKRPLLIILLVVFTSATVNSLFLQPSFYSERFVLNEKKYRRYESFFYSRVYDEALHSILCFYKTDHSANTTRASLLTDAQKQTYIFSIIIIRVVIPFVLLLAANIFLFITLGFGRSSQIKLGRTSLVRHGHHRQATPMIFFSSCILLLTISPR